LLASYIERLWRTGAGLLAASLLLTAMLQLQPGPPIDPGVSLQGGRAVAELVSPRLLHTLTTLAISLAYALPLALLLGIPAGRRPDSLLDRVLQAPVVADMGVPAFVGSALVIGTLVFKSEGISLPAGTQLARMLLVSAWMARAVRNGLADSQTDGAAVPWGKAVLLMLGRVLQQTGNLLAITLLVEPASGGGQGIWILVSQAAAARDLAVVYGALWSLIPVVLVGHLAGDLLVTAAGGEAERPAGRISRSWLVLGALLAALLLIMPLLGGREASDFLDITNRLKPPGPGHLFGTDQLGRDMLNRAAAGTRTSLTIAGAATLLALIPAALLSTLGWGIGRWGMAILTPRTAVPALFGPMLAGLLGALTFGPSVGLLIVCLGLASIPSMTLAFRQLFQPGRTIAPVGGALPALAGVLLLILAQNLLAESAISFMGFGVLPPMASLGTLAQAAIIHLRPAPYLLWAVLPGALGTAGLMLIGHSLTGAGRERL
jgi:peptide/nickel transport system permease protein